MAIVPVNPLPTDNRLYTNITPFTVRDNATYIIILEAMRQYINDKLVPFINENIKDLEDHWTEEVAKLIASWEEYTNELIQNWNQLSADLIAQVNEIAEGLGNAVAEAQAAKDAAEAARDLAEQFAGNVQAFQDSAVALLIEGDTTETRAALDAAYTSAAQGATMADLLVTHTDEIAQLVANKADKAEVQTAIDTLNAAMLTKADISTQETVEAGRLSPEAMEAEFRQVLTNTISVKEGGARPTDLFQKLRNGIDNVSSDVRVIFVGSSNAASGTRPGVYVEYAEQGTYWRLAYRSGAAEVPSLGTVTAPVSAGPMRWWNGAQGNTTSVDYLPAARMAALTNVQPDYVIHQIGENDLYYKTTIADYTANMRAHAEAIENAQPNVVQVFVHSPGRSDVADGVASWASYGEALKSVVDERPESRYFVDSTEYFNQFGVQQGIAGGVMYDAVHLNETGNLYLANVIGDHMNIPSESDHFPTPIDKSFDSFATVTFTGTTQNRLTRLLFQRTRYPRIAEVNGNLWIAQTNAVAGSNPYIQARFLDHLGGTHGPSSYRVKTNDTTSTVFNSRHYIAPGLSGAIELLCYPGGSMNIQGTGHLSNIRVTFKSV